MQSDYCFAKRFIIGNNSNLISSRQSFAGPRFFLGTITIIAAGKQALSRRKNSRNNLLIRLRVTALPTLRETAKPVMGALSSLWQI